MMSDIDRSAVRVLVVDDEDGARRFAVRALTDIGYDCDAVASTQEARKALTNALYDLLLTDLNLEDGTGTELLRWVSRHHRFLPVVLMTGYPTVASAVDAMRLDAVDYLVKPCEDLGRVVTLALERARQRRADRQDLRSWAVSLRNLADRLDSRAGSDNDDIGGGQVRDDAIWDALSAREREVAQGFVSGLSVRAIATKLGISENTVRNHLKSTYRKLDVSSQVELMRKVFGGN
ncbi:MAG: response regulator transcription factor [Myxococcales bacterium]|nr:response regulator transcription factor [Myxococcales bacterium]MDD9968000.1 response regulator transcription factor [Myxococcales bacterium]